MLTPIVRWTASRKQLLIEQIRSGVLAEDLALAYHEISKEEFDLWCRDLDARGVGALRATYIKGIRDVR